MTVLKDPSHIVGPFPFREPMSVRTVTFGDEFYTMTPEIFIIEKAVEAIKDLYGSEVNANQLQVQVTRKEFEGDYTLVVFPLLKMSKTTPENTGNAIGEWLKTNVPEISAYNTVKGFLNLSFSEVYWNGVFAEIASAIYNEYVKIQ